MNELNFPETPDSEGAIILPTGPETTNPEAEAVADAPYELSSVSVEDILSADSAEPSPEHRSAPEAAEDTAQPGLPEDDLFAHDPSPVDLVPVEPSEPVTISTHSMSGGEGRDIIFSFALSDVELDGGDGDDLIESYYSEGGGNDVLRGDGGDDTLSGGAGNDIIYGGDDNDTLYGCHDDDTMYGGDGNDHMEGGNHSDTLYGGDGDDSLNGGECVDTIDGGAGRDVIYLLDLQSVGDTILGWEDGVDRFAVTGSFADLIIEQLNGYVRIATADGELAMVKDADAAQFSADDFIFV